MKNFYLWEDLGRGADGRAFLVSGGTRNAVGVLKFFNKDAEKNARHEMQMWKEVYPELEPVKKTVRVLQVMGNTALLMPWFQPPDRTESELTAVEATLKNDYKDRGVRHYDVAWWNVGVYGKGDQTKAIVFDMQSVRHIEQDPLDDWVNTSVESLSKKLSS